MPIRWHVDDPELLREAIVSTATEMDYTPRLVEKDYFCSVLLEQLSTSEAGITFKGGTCLSKIHGNLYRLSEDLDFTISTPPGATRADRRSSVEAAKTAFAALPKALRGFTVLEPLGGANNSSQYNGTLGYRSLVDEHTEPIRVEISVSEPTLLAVEAGRAHTAVLDPVTGRPLIPPFTVETLSYDEAMAEKVRAALCRRDVAIRDYFDVDHAVQSGTLDLIDPAFLDLVRRKIVASRTGPVNVSDARVADLRRQLHAQLLPVLRERDFVEFDLARAVSAARGIAQKLARR